MHVSPLRILFYIIQGTFYKLGGPPHHCEAIVDLFFTLHKLEFIFILECLAQEVDKWHICTFQGGFMTYLMVANKCTYVEEHPQVFGDCVVVSYGNLWGNASHMGLSHGTKKPSNTSPKYEEFPRRGVLFMREEHVPLLTYSNPFLMDLFTHNEDSPIPRRLQHLFYEFILLFDREKGRSK